MKSFFLYLFCVTLTSFPVHALKLYLLSDNDKAGDHNQVLGIKTAFEQLSRKKPFVQDLNTKILTPSEIKNIITKSLLNEKVVVVGAGEGGIKGISELTKQSNLIVCLTSHMFLEPYKDKKIMQNVDFIALPHHIAPDVKAELGAKLIETIGVAHNRYPDTETYEKWKQDLPPADIYIGVYLGGDAPTQTNEMKLFTEQDAELLADYIIATEKEFKEGNKSVCILVLNGPRTGKYDSEKKEILDVHRKGKTDPITEFFSHELADKNIQYKVFDFQYNTPENKEWVSPYNSFDLVMGAVKKTKGRMIVPGESTSVVSEAIDVMFPDKVFVYNNSAMNDVHHAHVKTELEAGRASILENYKDVITSKNSPIKIESSAALTIAERLLRTLNAKK